MNITGHSLTEASRSLKAFDDILDSTKSEMLVKVFSVTMVMLTGHLIYGIPVETQDCPKLCSAGEYYSNCKCLSCNPGFFTKQQNRETSCYRCFQTCKPENNMEVVDNCTLTSDVKCRCQKGYECTSPDQYTGQCNRCSPVTTTSLPAHSITDIPASTVSVKPRTGSLHDKSVWIAPTLFSIILFVMILALFLQFCRKKEKECFKQIVRQCSLGTDVSSETMPPSQPEEQFHDVCPPTIHTDSFHQPVSPEQAVPPGGNLGPLHIYGPQTVFVSLLNQFGWDGGEKKAHDRQEESLKNTKMSYPQSPPVHLSEEERSGDSDSIFFPSQEQGKECHISKEEVL